MTFLPLLLLLVAQPAPLAQPDQSAPAAEPPIDWDAEFGAEARLRDPATGEFPVAPYGQSNANAGARPFADGSMARAFGGQAGIRRIADRTVALSEADRRIAAVFAATDTVRLRRLLFEQFCHILNAGCDYSGRDMATAHRDLGLQRGELNALVENLQAAMREADVPFAAQNRFLAKLAPMERDVVVR